jgi:hypothetical protein
MTFSIARSIRTACLSLGMVLLSTAWAQCNDRALPLNSPVSGVRLQLVGKLKGHHFAHVARLQDMSYVFEDYRVQASTVRFDEKDSGYTNTFTVVGGTTIYWEPDGKGGERICREERWESRRYTGSSYPTSPSARESRDAIRKIDVPDPVPYRPNLAQERNPILKKITPYYFVRTVRAFYYNSASQLVEATHHDSDEVNTSSILKKSREYREDVTPSRTDFCAFYDAKGRPSITAQLGYLFGTARTCAEVGRDKAKVKEFIYGKNGQLLAEIGTQATPKLSDKPKKEWSESEEEKIPLNLAKYGAWSGQAQLLNNIDSFGKDLYLVANLNEKHGVFEIRSNREELGIKDYTKLVPRTPKGERDMFYIFPDYTPPSILQEGMAGIYKHHRVLRTTWGEKGAALFEEFLPNSHQLNRRSWYGLEGGYRDEFYKNGRLTRAINRSYALEDAGYKEDLRRYADIGVLKVTPSDRFHENYRLYEYDEKGNETFKLMCWDHDTHKNAPWKKFPWWQPEAKTMTESQEETYRQNNVSMRCGTPDGQNVLPAMDITIDQYMKKTYSFGEMRTYPFAFD